MKINEDLEWFLLGGDPIFVEGAGNVYPFKLGEIRHQIRFSVYNSIIYVLFNGNKSSNETLFKDIIENCTNDVQYQQMFLFALETLFKTKVEFNCGFFSIIHQDGTGVLSSDNYDSFLNIVRLQCCIKIGEEDYNPANEKAKEMIEKLKKGKVNKPVVKNDRTMIRLISGLANKSKHYSYFTVWDLTIYQLYDACNKEGILDDIYYTLLGYYTGNIAKESIDFRKMDWTNKPTPINE